MTGLPRYTELRSRTPLRPGKPLVRNAAPLALVGARVGVGGVARPAAPHDTIPAKVRQQVSLRDPWCVHCGRTYGLHCHHRRLKGSGGDPRPHTDCSCNIVRLCWRDHALIHDTADGRRLAEAEGLIISGAVTEPWTEPVLVQTQDSEFAAFPTCDGRWSKGPPSPDWGAAA
jgi:hypothetical protein